MNPSSSTERPSGAFAPLAQPVFAVLWVATVLGNTGSFMRDVASAWLMTDLSGSPAAVAMVQAAATLPIFLLAIPAGVLTDIVDRRKLLIFIQLLLASVSLTLMILTTTGQMSVTTLIAATFIGGIGAALMGPTWQAIVPELVARTDIKSAIALNSLGINISRAIGPALGGILLAAFGAGLTYGVDVATYGFVIAALLWWKRPAMSRTRLSESFGGAFRAGLRYVKSSRPLHRVLIRAFVFYLFASALWALLPLVARTQLMGDAGFYGLLLGAVGVGAIGGAIALPRMRPLLSPDGLVLAAALISAVAMAVLSVTAIKALALGLGLLTGGAWITALTTLNSVAQGVLPNWVRGRALAVYLTVFNGAMTIGSLGWGVLATHVGLRSALLVAATGLILTALVFHRFKLPSTEADLSPSVHWPEPAAPDYADAHRGPVMILIEYQITEADRSSFLAAIHRLSDERRRDGAMAWGITEDSHDPQTIVEWFLVESWVEHLRQHQRVSRADADLQAEVHRFHQGTDAPKVRHLINLT